MTALALVRPEEIDLVAPQFLPLLTKACARAARFGAEDVLAWARDGRMQVWCAVAPQVQALCVTEILVFPLAKVLSVVILTGERMRDWLHHLTAIADWARAQGCSQIEAFARPGWARVLKRAGFSMTHVRIERDLGHAVV